MKTADSEKLVWIDMEMTGLDPDHDQILEAAVLVTDANLDVLAIGPTVVIAHSEEVLATMDAWNQKHHTASGLVARVRRSSLSVAEAEEQLLAFISPHGSQRTLPLAGNSIHQDRRFIQRYWPRLDAFLHYRMVDVSTVKELARRWYPNVFANRPKKNETHRAIDDIQESLTELRYYRNHVFR